MLSAAAKARVQQALRREAEENQRRAMANFYLSMSLSEYASNFFLGTHLWRKENTLFYGLPIPYEWQADLNVIDVAHIDGELWPVIAAPPSVPRVTRA